MLTPDFEKLYARMDPVVVRELRKLTGRVEATYANPIDFINELAYNSWFFQNVESILGSNFHQVDKSMKTFLDENRPEQIVAIANSGLILGAMAARYGYPVKAIEAHKRRNYIWNFRRNRQRKWYRLKVGNCEGEIGVLDIDKIEPGRRTVVMDEYVSSGTDMKAVLDHLGRKGVEVEKVVLYHCYERFWQMNKEYRDLIHVLDK